MNGNMESHWSRVGEFLLTTFLPPPSCDPVIYDTQARGNQWWNFTKLTDKYTKLASRGLFILNEAEISWTYCNIVVTLIIIIIWVFKSSADVLCSHVSQVSPLTLMTSCNYPAKCSDRHNQEPARQLLRFQTAIILTFENYKVALILGN